MSNLLHQWRNETLKKDVLSSGVLSSYIKSLEVEREALLCKEIPVLSFSAMNQFYVDGNRLTYERNYFERRKRLLVFGLSLWLHEREEDKRILEDLLFAICNEYTWALPAHTDLDHPQALDLFATETGFALAEIAELFGYILNPVIVERCQSEVKRRVLVPFTSHDSMFNWESMKNNWAAVCGGSILASATYLCDTDLLKVIYRRLELTFRNFVDSFEDDGTCLEGLGYWTYGMSFYCAASDLIVMRLGDDYSLLNHPRIKAIVTFQQKCYMGNGMTVSFSDGSREDTFRLGLTHYLCQSFAEVVRPPLESASGLHSDSCYRWVPAIRDLIWSIRYRVNDIAEGEEVPSINQRHNPMLPKAQWLLLPQTTHSRYAAAFKGGHNDEPHNHNDIGHFIFYKNGKDYLADLGAGEYTKEYFGDGRYDIFCNSAWSHSIPIIDNQVQREGRRYRSILRDISDRQMVLDMTGAYQVSILTGFIRTFDFSYENGMTLTDDYSVDEEISVVERFVSYTKPDVIEDAVLLGDVVLEYCSDEVEIEEIKVTETDHYAHDGTKVVVYISDFSFSIKKGTTKLKFEIR